VINQVFTTQEKKEERKVKAILLFFLLPFSWVLKTRSIT